MRKFLIVALVAAVGWFASETFVRKRAIDASLAGDIQRLIDDNFPGNPLAVSSVVVPISVAAPFYHDAARNGVVPAKFEGYFTLKAKAGALASRCDLQTVGYEVSMVAADMAIAISPVEADKLRACL